MAAIGSKDIQAVCTIQIRYGGQAWRTKTRCPRKAVAVQWDSVYQL
jgi:hypothetical protein